MVCLGLGVAVALTLLLSGVRQLLLVQAEDVMHKLVLLTRLDHPASDKHTRRQRKTHLERRSLLGFIQSEYAIEFRAAYSLNATNLVTNSLLSLIILI